MTRRLRFRTACAAFPLLAVACGAGAWRSAGAEPAGGEVACTLTPDGAAVCRAAGSAGTGGTGGAEVVGAERVGDTLLIVHLAIRNRSPGPLGTVDGATVSGFRVVLEGAAADGGGEPRLLNGDGREWETAGGGPFLHHDEVVPAGGVSSARPWKWAVARGTREFRFGVRVQDAGDAVVPDRAPNGWLVPPDSARRLFARENLIVHHPRVSGPYPRNLVQVYFDGEAPTAARQAAVGAVLGEVIGGDGLYHYVLLHVESVTDPVWWAHDRLRPLPQVVDVQPIFFDFTF
jgi:hypothetical protein